MKPGGHKIYVGLMAVIVTAVLIYLVYTGYSYYSTSLEERFYHPAYDSLKPSGIIGHGIGILGSLFMLIGVSSYMMRKRMRSLSRLGKIKHWLEFHIFMCILGPILVLFHTSFKFGGVVAISFWSMVAVFLSGIVGRFNYLQIPRSIEGRELNLNEIRDMKSHVGALLKEEYKLEVDAIETILASTRTNINPGHLNSIAGFFRKNREDRKSIRRLKVFLKMNDLTRDRRSEILNLVKNEITINRRISRLQAMQGLFRYWHVAHLPFALVMLIIMVIHVLVTLVFGYRWIF